MMPTISPRRVLHLLDRWEAGGVRRHVLDLTEGLEARGVESVIGAWAPLRSIDAGSRPFEYLPLYGKDGKRRSPFTMLRTVQALRAVIRAHVPDIVHVHSRLLLPVAMAAGLAFRTRGVATVHNVFEDYSWLPYPRHIICVSEEVRRSMGARCAVSTQYRCKVIPHGIAVVERSRAPLQQGPPRILYVGRLVEEKGVETLLRAFAMLSAERDCSLTIVGNGPLLQSLMLTAEELGVRAHVDFTGWRDDVDPYYQAADVCVLPSLSLEGFGYAALEAMAHGLPVLVSDLPVFDSLVPHGEMENRFRRGDVADLFQRLKDLVQAPDRARQLGAEGVRLAGERHSAERMVRETVEVYCSVLDTRQGP